MNILRTKFAPFSICFALGVGTGVLWSTFGPAATQKLDTVIVDGGVALLARVKSNKLSPYQRGRIDAGSDIQNGILRVKSLGLLTVVHGRYGELLKQNYDIEFVDYGCVGTAEFAESIRGYNEVSKAAIERQYGEGILARALEEAVREYNGKPSYDTNLPALTVPPNKRLQPTPR
jgi:hypothetical protein